MAAIAFWSTHAVAPSKQLAVSQDSPPGKARSRNAGTEIGELKWTESQEPLFQWNCPIPLHLTWRLSSRPPWCHDVWSSSPAMVPYPFFQSRRPSIKDLASGSTSIQWLQWWNLQEHRSNSEFQSAKHHQSPAWRPISCSEPLQGGCFLSLKELELGVETIKTLNKTSRWMCILYHMLQVQDEIDIWKLHSEEHLLDKLEMVTNTDVSSSVVVWLEPSIDLHMLTHFCRNEQARCYTLWAARGIPAQPSSGCEIPAASLPIPTRLVGFLPVSGAKYTPGMSQASTHAT